MAKVSALSDMPSRSRLMQEHYRPRIPRRKYHYTRSKYELTKFDRHHFICFDGEGYNVNNRHEYIYLACYDGKEHKSILNKRGLSTDQCFNFLIENGTNHWSNICVIYGGSYDTNMMLKDVTRWALERLHKEGKVDWEEWSIAYAARKYLRVTNRFSRKSVMLWDVIGFFQSSFVTSLTTWLGIKDADIEKGKQSRRSFRADRLPFITEYCNRELVYFEQLMQRLWECLKAAGLRIRRWDGAGSIAAFLMKKYKFATCKGSIEEQDKYYFEARSAYAGGRFELFMPGDYQCKVYNYDINSAYPFGIAQLPPFSGLTLPNAGKFPCGCSSRKIHKYDLLKIEYNGDSNIINPFFHRHANFDVSYPWQHIGWHWAPEVLAYKAYNKMKNCKVLMHLHWHDNGSRPLSWVADLYKYRQELKAAGDKAELAVKLGINSLYGKMVQQKGWKPGKAIPFSHQLYMGGWVTANTRSMIYTGLMQSPESMIACETDSIFSLIPLNLPQNNELGGWDLKIYNSLTYVQNGMYFGELADGYYKKVQDKTVTRYRGLNKGSLKRKGILDAWQAFEKGGKATIKAPSTRFRTLGTSLVGTRFKTWRQWITEKKDVSLIPQGKRLHDPTCNEEWGLGHYHLTMPVQPKEMESMPYNVLWSTATTKHALYEIIEEEWESIVMEN